MKKQLIQKPIQPPVQKGTRTITDFPVLKEDPELNRRTLNTALEAMKRALDKKDFESASQFTFLAATLAPTSGGRAVYLWNAGWLAAKAGNHERAGLSFFLLGKQAKNMDWRELSAIFKSKEHVVDIQIKEIIVGFELFNNISIANLEKPKIHLGTGLEDYADCVRCIMFSLASMHYSLAGDRKKALHAMGYACESHPDPESMKGKLSELP
ncbi:hypothetical protein KJ780_00420 [Candidatus Micrarchaeota archaeon]|nr:hypothetical protein [Candidatus Micrarchaeota archaeon]